MEILIMFIIGCIIVSIQEWIAKNRLNKVRRLLGKVECAKHTLPDGKVEMLGPGELFFFDKQKVGVVTSLCSNKELDEAEKLIKEAKEKKI